MSNENENKPATQTKPAPTLRSLLSGEQFKAEIARALPKHLSADRFIRIAITALTRTPMLMECEQAGFFEKLLTLSQLGLEPDGRRAHLIPFRNNKRGVVECQLIIDYKGLVELVMRGGEVSNLHADIVCENDEFEYDIGEIKKHKIDFKKPRGNAYAVYALARFRDGALPKCEVMHVEEVESVRKRSRAGTSGPWVSDWSEMAKKTAFRRLSKWLPLSPELRDADERDDDRFENATIVTAEEVPQSTKARIEAAMKTTPASAPTTATDKPEVKTVAPDAPTTSDVPADLADIMIGKGEKHVEAKVDESATVREALIGEIISASKKVRGTFKRALADNEQTETSWITASLDVIQAIHKQIMAELQ